MSKEGEGMVQGSEDVQVEKEIVLTITLKHGTKYPEVEGPLHNEPLCFYLLKYAELSIIQTNNAPSQIAKPHVSLLNRVRGKF